MPRRYKYSKGGFDVKSIAALGVIAVCIIIVLCIATCPGEKEEASAPLPPVTTTTTMPKVSDTQPEDAPDVTAESTAPSSKTEKVSKVGGTYSRTNVKSADAATLKITDEKNGIKFTLITGKKTYTGTASLTGSTADWEGKLKFEFSKDKVKVSGKDDCKGTYTAGEPKYTDTADTTKAASKYNAKLKDSSAVRNTLKKMMKKADLSLLDKALSKGSNKISSGSSEYVTDKNGKGLLIDAETGMNKYQYFLEDECEVMLLCDSKNVCVALCDYNQVRYYASSSTLKKNIPSCIKSYFTLAYSGVEIIKCN